MLKVFLRSMFILAITGSWNCFSFASLYETSYKTLVSKAMNSNLDSPSNRDARKFPKLIYGGVQLWLDAPFTNEIALIFIIIDLPLCIVADTVLLPITIPLTANYYWKLPSTWRSGRLIVKIKKNDIAGVRKLIDLGADINLPYYDKTPLGYAVQEGNVEIVNLLLEKGADPNTEFDNHSLLIFAINQEIKTDKTQKFEITRLLVEKGKADLDISSSEGDTPLHIAAGYGNLKLVQSFVEHGADINAKDENDQTPLHKAAIGWNLDVVKFLVHHGANLNSKDDNGQTPLHITTKWNEIKTIQYLLKHGADINSKDNNGQTPLHLAMKWNEIETIEYLLKQGADINSKDDNGQSPLFEAIRWNSIETIQYLLKHGADRNLKNRWGHTPLEHARKLLNQDAVKILEKNP